MGFVALKDAETVEQPKGGFTPLAEVKAPAEAKRFLGGPEDRAAVGRQLGLTARAGVMGLTAIPNMFGNAFGLRSSQTISDALTKLGLPEPQNATERVVQDVAGGMAGAGSVAKGSELVAKSGNALVQRVGKAMADRAGTQVVSGATGGGAAGVTREAGGGEIAQLAAGVAGGAVPAVPALAAAATRAAMRGGEAGRVRMQNNIDTFEDAGAGTPTVGQATESRGNRAIESVMSKTPGSAGRMAAKADEEAAGLGAKVEGVASNLAGPMDAARAGRRIKGGLEQFVDRVQGAVWEALRRARQAHPEGHAGRGQQHAHRAREAERRHPGGTGAVEVVQEREDPRHRGCAGQGRACHAGAADHQPDPRLGREEHRRGRDPRQGRRHPLRGAEKAAHARRQRNLRQHDRLRRAALEVEARSTPRSRRTWRQQLKEPGRRRKPRSCARTTSTAPACSAWMTSSTRSSRRATRRTSSRPRSPARKRAPQRFRA
jgi:hypothetical protein